MVTDAELIPAKTKRARRGSMEALSSAPIIQFISPIVYADEGTDSVILLDVTRIGDTRGTAEVYYETEDDSAKSGRAYVAKSGKLVFKPGESMKQIEVEIIDNELWDSTVEFGCKLLQEGLKGASLGKYLFTTRIKIIDNDAFPTADFDDLNTAEKVAKCPKWPLLFGYFQMVSNIPGVWRGTVKYMLVDLIHNLWYLFNLIMTVYLLDYIIDASYPSSDLIIPDRRKSLFLCSVISLVAVAILHVLDYRRIDFGIASPVRNFVQSALLRKFLNYKNIVRETLQPGVVMMGIQRDSVDLVNFGYFNMLKALSALSKMICMLCFKLLGPLIFGGTLSWHGFLLMLGIMVPLTAFFALRQSITSKCLQERLESHNYFSSQIATITENSQLVIDYSLRNHCDHVFIAKQQVYSSAVKHALQVLLNNEYCCTWCKNVVIAFWILYGGLEVIEGRLTIGLFVTNLRLFQSFGNAFSQLYRLAVKMMNTFPALENVATLMNHPTDVRVRYRLERAQRSKLLQSVSEHSSGGIAIDMMPIVLDFQHPFRFEGKPTVLNFIGTVEIEQGQLVAVAGPLGCGKATLLRLIVGSVLPIADRASPIFVPSHLRAANVSDEPLFFGGPLFENLIFGMDKRSADASRERVKSICKCLTRSEIITDSLDSDEEQAWKDVFSGAQCKLLAIARALIRNNEVLCIHKPLAKLTNEDSEHVMEALHDHVENKGLYLNSDVDSRRPRTVIVSAASDRAISEAHNVVLVDPLCGISMLRETH